jgi:glycosyltransferase involved in cell wall biosynthesis
MKQEFTPTRSLFSVANNLFRNRCYEGVIGIYEFLSEIHPDFAPYAWNEAQARKKLAEQSGQTISKKRFHFATASEYQKRLRIAHFVSELSDPGLVRLCFTNTLTSADAQPLLAEANALIENGYERWLEKVNCYLTAHDLSPLALRAREKWVGDGVFLNLIAPSNQRVDGPLVTICMSCFNAEPFVEHAVRSILNQSYRNIELFLFNDQSEDNTLKILERLAREDKRITVIGNKRNQGTYVSRNEALARAKGEFFTVMDADDFALPNRIALQVSHLQKHQEIIGLMTDWVRLDLTGRFFFKQGWGGGYQHEAVATLMFRTEPARKKIGYWDAVRFGADSEFMNRLKIIFGESKVELLKVPTVFALNHESSLTNNPITGIDVGGKHGLSPVRRAYRDAWMKWHEQNGQDLYIPHPLSQRSFDAPNEIHSMDAPQLKSEFHSGADSSAELTKYVKKIEEISNLSFHEQIKLVKESALLHSNWYFRTYPDAAKTDMNAVEHYLKIGAQKLYNPSNLFNTQFYMDSYPDVANRRINPLVHYQLVGSNEGRICKPVPPGTLNRGRKEVETLRKKLLTFGFTEEPLVELKALLWESENTACKAYAARELALWHLRCKTDEDYRISLDYLAHARKHAPTLDFRRGVVTVQLLCHYHLGDLEAGRDAYRRALFLGEADADAALVWTNFQSTPEGRLSCVNQVLMEYKIPTLDLLSDTSLPTYDRLTCNKQRPLYRDESEPKVSVLVAAYNAVDTIETTLRSLQDQTWPNLEILVVDDASTDATAFVVEKIASTDQRIRLIRMEENGGAYVARNRGLTLATGEYVTLQDADDWSHPLRIETQVTYMKSHPEISGCTVQQARATSALDFPNWAGAGGEIKIIKENVSSLLFHRASVVREVGGWDTVRFGADSEIRARIKKAFGPESIAAIQSGPLSFQRVSSNSAIADEKFGYDGYFFGARYEYLEGQQHFNSQVQSVKRDNLSRRTSFSTPIVMRPDRAEISRKFKVILGSEFRMHGGSTRSNVEEMAAQRRAGIRSGVFQMYRYDFESKDRIHMFDDARNELDNELCSPIVYGEEVHCDLLILRYPPILHHRQRYIPKIHAKEIKVIVNQSPMSDYTPDGVLRYDLARCAENIRHYFGKDATWHPIGPLVRDALEQHHANELHHIHLSGQDWHNIIDISGWSRGTRTRHPEGKLRIGRHSRDSFVKWPETKEDILAAYPAKSGIEVHILGGATSPASLIGEIPKNWIVHEFGIMHPKEFLAHLDVFIYFSHPNWIESFGRTIIEAMAVGIPVILPEIYKPLFRDAAFYATPQAAVEIALELHENSDLYNSHVERALAFVRKNFSYETHVERLNGLIPIS